MGRGPIDPKLFAAMERSALGAILGGIHLTGGPAGTVAVLVQDPVVVDAISLPLCRIANTLLPMGQVDAVQMGVYKRQLMPLLPTFAGNVASSLEVLGRQGISLDVLPAPVLELMKKKGTYAGYRLLGMQIVNIGMDQRQISGAFLVFLIERVVTVLDRRFSDPKVPQAEKSKLLDDFGPALLDLDQVLRNPAARKQQLGAERRTLEQQAQDAVAEAQMAETSMRLLEKIVVPREQLFAAARRHQQTQPQGPGVLSDLPAVVPGGILR